LIHTFSLVPGAYDPLLQTLSDERDLRLGKCAKELVGVSLGNTYHVIEKIGN
jgi:hypothetical protein